MTTPYSGNDNFNNEDPQDESIEYKYPPMGAMPSYDPTADPNRMGMGPSRPGAGIRLVSFIIDSVVISLAVSIIAYLFFRDRIIAMMEPATGAFDMEMLYGSLILLVLWFVYRAGMESSSFGGSLGKIWTNQRVTTFDGGQVTFSQALIRNGYYLIQSVLSLIPILGLLLSIGYCIFYGVSISRDPYNQSQTDHWAQAYVIARR